MGSAGRIRVCSHEPHSSTKRGNRASGAKTGPSIVLRPGGALVLWLPNVESVEAALLRTYWIGYDAPRHLTTFGITTLRQALAIAGLNVAEIRHEAVGLEWAWALRLLAREHLPAAEPLLRRLHPLLIVAATPLAAIGTALGRSGRVRVIAVKTTE